jgi:hypothetical protein
MKRVAGILAGIVIFSVSVLIDPAIQAIEGVEVHVLRTPAAFDLFNEYVSRGRTVVLIAHSTC